MREGAEHGETETARTRHWLMRWQHERVDNWLKWQGFIGQKFLRDKFDKAFAEHFSTSSAMRPPSIHEVDAVEAAGNPHMRQRKPAPKSKLIERALKKQGFDRDRQGKSLQANCPNHWFRSRYGSQRRGSGRCG